MNCPWCEYKTLDSHVDPRSLCRKCQNQWHAMDRIMKGAGGLVTADYRRGVIWSFFNCGDHAVIILARVYFDLAGTPMQWGAYIGVSHNVRDEYEAAAEVIENENLTKLYYREAIGFFPTLRDMPY